MPSLRSILFLVIIFPILISLSCQEKAAPDEKYIKSLQENLDIQLVRMSLGLTDINEAINSVNLHDDPVKGLSIVSAKIEQFLIWSKADIIKDLAALSYDQRSQIIANKLWSAGICQLHEIRPTVGHIQSAFVEPLIKQMERSSFISNEQVDAWEQIKNEFNKLTAAIDAVDTGRSDEFVDPDIDQVRAIEKAIKTARLIREKNLPTS